VSLADVLALSIQKLGDVAALPCIGTSFSTGDVAAWLPSGITPLDFALGGGLPLGRMTELYSRDEGDGKSSLAIHFAVSTQKAGGVVIWLESEAALDKPRAARMGLQLANVIIYGPPTIEDGFAYIRNIIRNVREDDDLKNVPVLIVWDTLAAAPTKVAKEDDNEYGQGIARKPRILSEALHDLTIEFFKYKVQMLFLNQTYTTFTRFGSHFVTPGGKALKFHASIRLELFKSGLVEDSKDQPIGIEVSFLIKKNKLALPNRKGFLILLGETGYDNILSMAKNFLEWDTKDMLRQGGGWYYMPGGANGTELKARWKDLKEVVKKSPTTLHMWTEKFAELWPLPKDRVQDQKTGWVLPIPGGEPKAKKA
jgi:recombination protein RecA